LLFLSRIWALYEDDLFDLTDYFNSISLNSANPDYQFLHKDITDLINERSGQDITKPLKEAFAKMDPAVVNRNIVCMKNAFKVGILDFRDSPRCLVSNYLLVVFSAILMASMALKCEFLIRFLLRVGVLIAGEYSLSCTSAR
jgi:chitin synthase